MNTCVCCGAIIPEGRHVCPNCETWSDSPDVILADGSRLYLKSNNDPVVRHTFPELQDMMLNYKRAVAMED